MVSGIAAQFTAMNGPFARTLFSWTEPKVPEGWHGAFAQPDRGTRVVIHEDDPKKAKKLAQAKAAEQAKAPE